MRQSSPRRAYYIYEPSGVLHTRDRLHALARSLLYTLASAHHVVGATRLTKHVCSFSYTLASAALLVRLLFFISIIDRVYFITWRVCRVGRREISTDSRNWTVVCVCRRACVCVRGKRFRNARDIQYGNEWLFTRWALIDSLYARVYVYGWIFHLYSIHSKMRNEETSLASNNSLILDLLWAKIDILFFSTNRRDVECVGRFRLRAAWSRDVYAAAFIFPRIYTIPLILRLDEEAYRLPRNKNVICGRVKRVRLKYLLIACNLCT